MKTPNPANEQCLTPEEQRELQELWAELQAALGPVGTRIESTEDVDCDQLYTQFLRLGDAFEAFEHVLMRTKQIRMLHSAHTDTS
jgi:hypothetical protein